MLRLACVELPALPLQLLLRRRPDWQGRPAAVVDRDHPQGVLLWIDETARRRGVLPGMRYGAAMSLVRELRTGTVSETELRRGGAGLLRRLSAFSPGIEAAPGRPGAFWLDASGLLPLYPSFRAWGRALLDALRIEGFQGRLAVGFTKFGTYAAARSGRSGLFVFDTPMAEKNAVRAVPLARLDIEPDLRDLLGRLDIRTVGQLLRLPAAGLQERFGEAARRLRDRVADGLDMPIQPRAPEEPLVARSVLDEPEPNLERLLFCIKGLLHPILETLGRRHEKLSALRLRLQFDGTPERLESVRPAEATRDIRQIMNLLHLRLEAAGLPAGVSELALLAEPARTAATQGRLFSARPRRDRRAGDRALARLRAEFGDDAVVRAVAVEAHLPEARFRWQPLDGLVMPRPARPDFTALVRRIHDPALPLPPRPRAKPDGWMLKGHYEGSVERFFGPYVISGGWWRRFLRRDYHYARMRNGALPWLYYDHIRRRWFLQGEVE